MYFYISSFEDLDIYTYLYIRYITCWFSNKGYVDTRQYANIQKHIY